MVFQIRRMIVALNALIVLMALSPPPTMAGFVYNSSATCDIAVDISNTSNSAWSFMANINQNLSGTSSGNGTFSNTASGGSQNLLPPPLFPGESTFAGTTGSSSLPGGSASSNAFNESVVSVFETNPTLLAFSVYTALNASYMTELPGETASASSFVTVLFNENQVYNYLSSMGTGGNSGLIYVYAPAGVSNFIVETSAGGTGFSPAPPSVPEPASIVMVMVFGGVASIGFCILRTQQR